MTYDLFYRCDNIKQEKKRPLHDKSTVSVLVGSDAGGVSEWNEKKNAISKSWLTN